MSGEPINAPPGAHIEARDAVCVDRTSSGSRAWHVIGLSEIVRDQPSVLLEEYEPSITVLDPRETDLTLDTSPGDGAARLFLESELRRVPSAAEGPVIGQHAALDALDLQLERARLALQQTRPRMQFGTVERTIVNDTQPGGLRQRTIIYEVPFDRCDRENDYEVAWQHFEARFGRETDA